MTQEVPDSGVAHRRRLLEGLASAVSECGYAQTTIADIVKRAGVSRRTFYEHFESKAQALTALYQAASHGALQVLRASIDPAHPWQTQVQTALTAYFQCLASNPTLLRTLFVEILSLGSDGLAARRHVNDELVDFMLDVVNGADSRADGGLNTTLPRELAVAVVGGIHELVMQAIEQEQTNSLALLAPVASELVLRCLALPASARKRAR